MMISGKSLNQYPEKKAVSIHDIAEIARKLFIGNTKIPMIQIFRSDGYPEAERKLRIAQLRNM